MATQSTVIAYAVRGLAAGFEGSAPETYTKEQVVEILNRSADKIEAEQTFEDLVEGIR